MKVKPTVAAPIVVCAVLALTLLFSVVPASALGLDDNPYLTTVILQLVIFMLPSLFFCTFRGTEYREKLRLKFPPTSSLLFVICSLVVMVCGSCVIEYFMSLVSPVSMAESTAAGRAAYAMNEGFFDGFYLVLAFALLPALTEEFLFRGIIVTEYGSLGIFTSVLMSSIMFAMCHLSLVRFPVYMFCGIILAIVAYGTRSVIAPMIVHAVYNVFVLFFEEYVLHLAEKQNISALLFVIIAAGCTILFASFMCFEAAGLYRSYAIENVSSDHVPVKKTKAASAVAFAVFSPSFIVLAVAYIIIVLVKR